MQAWLSHGLVGTHTTARAAVLAHAATPQAGPQQVGQSCGDSTAKYYLPANLSKVKLDAQLCY